MAPDPRSPQVGTPPGPYAHLSVEPVSTVDRVVEELRRALFDGELAPGTPLREVGLAEALGVSRSTVREALGVLVAESLADRIPNKGTVVHLLTAEEIRDVSRARAVLEEAGVRRWSSATEEARAAVRTALRDFEQLARTTASTAQLAAAHLAIHQALIGLIGSARLVALAETLYAEIRLTLAGVDRARRNIRELAHSHADLLRILETGDVAAAVEELAGHLADAEQSLLETLEDPTGSANQ